MSDYQTAPSKSEWYRHGDIDEIVFAVEEERVLTVREYPTIEQFTATVTDAEYVGKHPSVADLPDVETFEDDR